jgi:hypothetical protein
MRRLSGVIAARVIVSRVIGPTNKCKGPKICPKRLLEINA